MHNTATGNPMARRARHVALLAALFLATSLVGVVGSATPASALCSDPGMDGMWLHEDPNTDSFVQAEIKYRCSDLRLCPIDGGPCQGGQSWVNVHLWGACSPTACDWGVVRTNPQSDGWFMGRLQQSHASYTIWVRTEVWWDTTYLRVSVFTDFVDWRTDGWSHDYFLPA